MASRGAVAEGRTRGGASPSTVAIGGGDGMASNTLVVLFASRAAAERRIEGARTAVMEGSGVEGLGADAIGRVALLAVLFRNQGFGARV